MAGRWLFVDIVPAGASTASLGAMREGATVKKMGLPAVLRSRLISPVVGLLLSFAAALGAAWLIWSIARLLRQHWLIDAQVIVSAWLIAIGAVAVAVWWAVVRDDFARALIAVRPTRAAMALLEGAGLGLVAGLAAAGWAGFVPIWAHWEVRAASSPGAVEVLAVLAGAASEEMWFRFVLLGATLAVTRSIAAAVAVSTALFTLAHPGGHLLYVATAGVWLASIALSARSIWAAAAAHFSANLVFNLFFTSSPLAHPSLLDRSLDSNYRAVFGTTVLVLAAWRLWPLLRDDAWVRCLQASRYPRMRRTSEVVE
jgi:membrane protease YdiL (CAAX protease family)